MYGYVNLLFSLLLIIPIHDSLLIHRFKQALEGSQELARNAWAYLNDSLRLDLCVRFRAESIACAAIYLASR